MKNALKVIIFIVAVLALCAGGIFGYTKYMKTDFDFSDGTKSGTVEITAYNGDSVNIIIPKKIRGKTVVQIAQSAFAKTDITSVEIPDTVTSVGEKAFANCEKLERVKIGNSVKSIGNSCFYNCKSLADINIPASVEKLEDAAFLYCSALTSPAIEDGANFVMKDGILYDKGYTTAYWISSNADLSNYTFPPTLKKLTAYLFTGHGELTTFTVPHGVTEIPQAAFLICKSLQRVTLHDNVTKIGDGAFLGCENLKQMYISKNVTQIGSLAFPGMGSGENGENTGNFKIITDSGSAAESYAEKNEIKCETANN